MSRHEETKAAIMDLLRELQATPEAPVNLYHIGVPLVAKGFTEQEIYMALRDIEGEQVIALDEGTNRLLLRKPLDG